MDPRSMVDCMKGVIAALDAQGMKPGSILHNLEQLKTLFELQARNIDAKIEQSFARSTVGLPKGAMATAIGTTSRDVDLVVRSTVSELIDGVIKSIAATFNVEYKSGAAKIIGRARDEMEADLATAIKAMRESPNERFFNIWKYTSAEFDATAQAEIKKNLESLAMRLKLNYFGDFADEEFKKAIGSLRLVDKVGRVLKAELDDQGKIFLSELTEEGKKLLGPAMKVVFGEHGLMVQSAEGEVNNSPNFGPAMEVLFGPSGKLADAAHDAATGANLDPALDPFEQKVEDGVKTALDKAGDDAKAHAASSLGARVGEGAQALGTILTAIPQMYDSVKQLGEVWDQPLNSVDDYMKLFGALGNTITQGVQTIEALAGVTKIASAAQAVFNAVMAMNPVVLIVLAVIALIAAIALLIVYWDQVKAALRDNPWLAVAASLLGIIGIIIVIIAYWDEIKLAVLIAANFISIQVQKIGAFFVGLGTLIGMVWDYIVATAANVGISIINFFITAGTEVQNFFIGLINFVLEAYNAIADSVIGDILGLEKAELIPEVDVETRLIPPKEVPTIDVEAAFRPAGEITGGLEGAIAEQEAVVAAGQKADAERRAREAAAQPPALPPGAGVPGAGGLPARPALPEGAGAALPGAGGGGVRVDGGITVNINAERLELDAVEVLSDEIVRRLKEKLDALRAEQEFRTGVRSPAPA